METEQASTGDAYMRVGATIRLLARARPAVVAGEDSGVMERSAARLAHQAAMAKR
jgi:hypothetical protein